MKRIYCYLLCATMTLASCTEEFSPSIDYGERTYINDYQKLVDAVNNLTSSMEQRMDALNKLLESGMADIRIAVDANTNDIQILNATIRDGLATINVTLLDGFKSLKSVMQDNGDRIVYALNSNGDLIALHLDQNGQLIEGTIKAQVGDLIKTLKDNNASLQDKLDAMSTIIETGMANIVVKIGETGNTLDVHLDANNGLLDSLTSAMLEAFQSLGDTLLDGFDGLNSTLKDNGDRIVYAINSNGELIALHLDQNGQLIDATIKAKVSELIQALKDNNTSLQSKLDAMSTIIETGLGNIEVKVGEVGDAIDARLATTNTNLSNINDNLLNGFTAVETKLNTLDNTLTTKLDEHTTAINKLNTDVSAAISTMQGNLVSAINNQGQLIIAALDANGNLITALQTAVITGMDENATSLKEAIENASEEELEKLETLINMQNGMMFSESTHEVNGVTKYDYVYMTSELYQSVMADATLKSVYQDMLYEIYVPAPTNMTNPLYNCDIKSIVPADNTPNYGRTWEQTGKAPAKLITTSSVVVDGHQWLVVRNVCEWTDLKISLPHNSFSHPYLYLIHVKDAKGNRDAFGGITATGVNIYETPQTIRLYNYNTETGVFYSSEEITDETTFKSYSTKNP